MYFVVVSVIDRLGIHGGWEKNILKAKKLEYTHRLNKSTRMLENEVLLTTICLEV